MDMKAVLARIDRRLQKLGLTDAAVSRTATGSTDTIRNWRRQVNDGKNPGASTTKLIPIAAALQTNLTWLTEEIGDEESATAAPAIEEEPRASTEAEVLRLLKRIDKLSDDDIKFLMKNIRSAWADYDAAQPQNSLRDQPQPASPHHAKEPLR